MKGHNRAFLAGDLLAGGTFLIGASVVYLGTRLGPVGILAPVGRLVRGVPAWVDRRLDARCDLGTVD